MEYRNYVERCSPPFLIWKMQIKTVNYSYIPIRMDGIPEAVTTPNAGKNVEQQELSFIDS